MGVFEFSSTRKEWTGDDLIPEGDKRSTPGPRADAEVGSRKR
jgi:hypothetical protein